MSDYTKIYMLAQEHECVVVIFNAFAAAVAAAVAIAVAVAVAAANKIAATAAMVDCYVFLY